MLAGIFGSRQQKAATRLVHSSYIQYMIDGWFGVTDSLLLVLKESQAAAGAIQTVQNTELVVFKGTSAV